MRSLAAPGNWPDGTDAMPNLSLRSAGNFLMSFPQALASGENLPKAKERLKGHEADSHPDDPRQFPIWCIP